LKTFGENSSVDLAVIIPAYKAQYLDKTLQSFVKQTCQDFTIYIGDDCSPHDLRAVIDRYVPQLRISYKRFDNNIGSRSLVSQWKRCVELSHSESWLWLFSDDDLVDVTCVEEFYKLIDGSGQNIDVCRFNTRVIDKDDILLYDTPQGPMYESSLNMAYYLLRGERGNSMPDHIFSRRVYEQTGGFVYTEFAQGADWATSIKFSQEKGMYIVPGAMVSWRYSGSNISSIAGQQRGAMVAGHIQFLKWVTAHFSYLQASFEHIDFNMLSDAIRINIYNVFVNHYKGINPSTAIMLFRFLMRELQLGPIEALRDLHKIDVNTGNRLGVFSRLKSGVRLLLNRS
jgi:glycosyltransferase involved in cell wall biosynthesis